VRVCIVELYQFHCIDEHLFARVLFGKFGRLELLQIVIFITDVKKMFTNTLDNLSLMRNVLQEYIYKHPKSFAMANGVQLRRVDEDFYKDVSEEDVARQLEIVRGLIYLNEAKHCAAKETTKACFKKLLKQSGVFSEHEIEVLLL
jgi:hypothetical protein